MSALIDSNLPVPNGSLAFEKMVSSCAQVRWQSESFTLYARNGQKQAGIDVFGKDKDGRFIVIQCKNTPDKITKKVINEEVQKARTFELKFDLYCIATSARIDGEIQKYVLELSAAQEAKGDFSIEILFWDNLTHILLRDEPRLYMHYPHLNPASGRTSGFRRDQDLFAKMETALPFNPTVRSIADHDFLQPFPYAYVRQMNVFLDEWRSSATSFHNANLQSGFRRLFDTAHTFTSQLAERTTFRGAQCNEIWVVLEEHRIKPNDDDVADALLLNDLACDFVTEYERFLSLCRETLFT